MAEIVKQGFDSSMTSPCNLGILTDESDTKQMGFTFAQQDFEQSKPVASDSFIALDIGSLVAAADVDSTASPRIPLQKTLSRKGSQREKKAAEGDTITHASKGMFGTCDKSSLLINVSSDAEAPSPPRATTPLASGGGGGRYRRNGKRLPPWLDPRRVLFFFATLSSMGTIILLYFTVSMGKMTGGDVDAR